MKPYLHAQVSAKKWGGEPSEYLAIHDFLDSPKAAHPDMRHRALLHNSFGIYVAERVFGTFITLSTGRIVQVRDIAEQHVIDDMGRIPTVSDYLDHLPMLPWLGGPKRKRTTTRIGDNAPSIDEISRAPSGDPEGIVD